MVAHVYFQNLIGEKAKEQRDFILTELTSLRRHLDFG